MDTEVVVGVGSIRLDLDLVDDDVNGPDGCLQEKLLTKHRKNPANGSV
ncbi:hypothetical protein ACIG56_22360 [Nocardia fusca]